MAAIPMQAGNRPNPCFFFLMYLAWYILVILSTNTGFMPHPQGAIMSYTRRQFASLSARAASLGLAARFTPSLLAQAAPRKINYAIIGIGRIAGHFLPASRMSQHSRVSGLVSGHRDKANRVAAEYNIAQTSIYSYEDFDRIANDPAIDAVYVALPNSMHAEYTIRAAKAGKHVLCEKPMATSVADSEKMIAACRDAKVKLMIAYRLHFEPITLQVRDIVRSGRLGKLQSLEGANGFPIGTNEWRTQRALAGGGSLFDVGIYCINAFRMFTGEEADTYHAEFSTIDKDDPRFREVEENVSWMMRFPSGVLATGATTYGANMAAFCKLNGTRGQLEYGPFGYEGQYLRGRCAISGEPGAPVVDIDESNSERDPMHFVRQMDHFSECILNNRTPQPPGEEGLADMRAMSAIYKSANVEL